MGTGGIIIIVLCTHAACEHVNLLLSYSNPLPPKAGFIPDGCKVKSGSGVGYDSLGRQLVQCSNLITFYWNKIS